MINVDIDECQTAVHTCEGDTMFCSNNEGSYTCECESGYEIDNTGTVRRLR